MWSTARLACLLFGKFVFGINDVEKWVVQMQRGKFRQFGRRLHNGVHLTIFMLRFGNHSLDGLDLLLLGDFNYQLDTLRDSETLPRFGCRLTKLVTVRS